MIHNPWKNPRPLCRQLFCFRERKYLKYNKKEEREERRKGNMNKEKKNRIEPVIYLSLSPCTTYIHPYNSSTTNTSLHRKIVWIILMNRNIVEYKINTNKHPKELLIFFIYLWNIWKSQQLIHPKNYFNRKNLTLQRQNQKWEEHKCTKIETDKHLISIRSFTFTLPLCQNY